ncbi:hypothetical protein [Massilia frigida]|nr:hypothetical protein [Massilia frigida]
MHATDRGADGHFTVMKGILGVIANRSLAAIDTYLDSGAIQIAIAGGTG